MIRDNNSLHGMGFIKLIIIIQFIMHQHSLKKPIKC